MIKEWKRSRISMAIVGFFVVSACFGLTITVRSELVKTTIFQEDFEIWAGGIPEEFASNTGWLENYYGTAHNGSGWAYSWSAGDTLTTPVITLGVDTELSFWYCAEKATNPMSLEVYIDTKDISHMIWNDSNFNHTSYENAIINLSDYPGDHQILFVGMKSDMYGQLLDDIIITSYVEEQDVNEDSGNGNGGSTPSADNIPPVADLSKGEPYSGYTNESIFFDGSLSYDSDGEIIKWFWELGDGTQKTGQTMSHQYEVAGTYVVVLHVLDDDTSENNDTTIVTILEGNNKPSIPIVKILSIPRVPNVFEIIDKNYEIDIMISSQDDDNDTIYFIIDWDDGIIEETEYVASNSRLDVNHSWNTAGRYNVTIISKDNQNASSDPAVVTVLMNLDLKYIAGHITGYLIDYANNGTYSIFFNAESKIETSVLEEGIGHYLIDYNDDGSWDYTFNETAGVVVYQYAKGNQTGDTSTGTPGFEILLICISLILMIIIKRKSK